MNRSRGSKHTVNRATRLPVSAFEERIICLNKLNEQGFREWVFHPGMLFGSLEKWWREGKRTRPHEGLDLCLFRDRKQVQTLGKDIVIPLPYSATVVKIEDDFLGKSIYVSHELYRDQKQLYTAYGHTEPFDPITMGTVLEEGEGIALIADTTGTKLPPHLHISLAWIPKKFPHEKLSWEALCNPPIVLLNPLDVLALNYSILIISNQESAGPP